VSRVLVSQTVPVARLSGYCFDLRRFTEGRMPTLMHFCLAYMLAVPVLEFPLLPPPQERNTGYWEVPGANLVIRVDCCLVEVWGHCLSNLRCRIFPVSLCNELCVTYLKQECYPLKSYLLCDIQTVLRVNRMHRNRLPRVMKHYSTNGRMNHGRTLKRLLDA
jgi:hypothetical protein